MSCSLSVDVTDNGQISGFARATEIPLFPSRDLILIELEVSELNCIVRFIVRTVCNQLHVCSC
jgi:hypothetical protein